MADSTRLSYTFIPRSVVHKKQAKGSQKPSRANIIRSSFFCSTQAKEENSDTTDDVKQYNSQQRWPAADEPVCVVCKRFGEYICDETDEDVCSLECKSKHLNTRKAQSGEAVITQDTSTSTWQHSFDLCYSSNVMYNPVKEISSISEENIILLREKFEIRTKGVRVPKLILNFNQCSFSSQLCKNLEENGFVSPTPVQMQVIPTILCGNDVLVSACTSSGKTASFILPIIHNIYSCIGGLPASHDFCKYPIGLILVPTRELASQIEEIAKLFCKSLKNFKTALLIGGVPLSPQLYRLKHKIQLIIGTPGRINDILENHGLLQLQYIKMVVLDEVDVMLQMGFQNQIQYIVEEIPGKPHYMMFSATIPPPIEDFASKMMSNLIFISVGLPGLPNKYIKQIVLWVEDVSKKKKLFSIIGDAKHFLPPALVFVDSKLGADMLCEAISEKFVLHCESIHSDKSQPERSKILQDFLAGAYDILVSTNVMGRGIDLLNVRQVILFDMPNSIEEYIHQIGRAGGLGSTGFVMSFINNSNKKIFLDLRELFKTTENKLPDQMIHSPYMAIESEKREKKRKQMKYKGSITRNNEKVNTQNLLQILTKNR